MKHILVLLLFVFIGCSQPRATIHKPLAEFEGKIFFEWQKNNPGLQRSSDLEQFRNSGARLRIETGEHPEIVIRGNTITSTKSNWILTFRYSIFPIFENDSCIILSSGSQVETIRLFSGVSYQWWVVRKADGKIINSLECSGDDSPDTLAVLSGCLYLFNPVTKHLWSLPLQ